ncbi:pyridoxamine 5'-phosphate oxidase family protein [Streptomyces buecherae]|uniref:pyridoxamine 5'-phosphate oxidase family protein n=1 Tax=Streptomyces buecherae TaxID=2763006 RepID=UPI0037B03CA3
MSEHAQQRTLTGPRHPLPRRMEAVERGEALRLLGSVPVGRVVFTQHALPAVRPVNHLVDGDNVIIRTHPGATLSAMTAPPGSPDVVVAYEADAIDPVTHLGWSVIVTGYAALVTDEEELAHYLQVLHPWVPEPMPYAIRIRPDLITGFRLLPADTSHVPNAGIP